MAIRLTLVPAVAISLLTTVSFASAQYYPAQSSDQGDYQQQAPAADAQQQMPAPQVPAAYDPYGSANGAGQAAAPQGQPAYGQPAAHASAPTNVPAGYPAGAYSGQPPAGMNSPYGATASQGYPAQQQAPAYPAQQQAAYGAPQPVGAVPPAGVGQSAAQSAGQGANGSSVAMLPPEDQPEEGTPEPLRPDLQKQLVDYTGKEAPGTIIIDTPNTHLYLVMPGGKAMRYGIGVGREGFTWAGTEKITAKKEWADWRPPAEMIERQPYLPRFMAGGPGNPLGARTMYLGATVYRIHGTNQPSTIGKFMSSGCIRMLNEDVEDLYDRVKLGTRVVVLPASDPQKTASVAPSAQPIPVSAPASSAVR
ncbi:L,D-transpeptidase family protein [Ancylobacter sp. 6x-1]|uniref:L,D-transpeptidase family protein n=1 Tax=Ancylobacter crimeensis TaxID=2579147 RepID=A0ABT0DAJ3_9HYPH|nr:L,D-transpeptidase [Ancylobacter crimeensis]MCK0196802.1 L,D-transpeptidase family protein [Ancylobacter crimeensis]